MNYLVYAALDSGLWLACDHHGNPKWTPRIFDARRFRSFTIAENADALLSRRHGASSYILGIARDVL